MIAKSNPFNGTSRDDLGYNSANEFMVGGSHYHQGDKSFQHWDLVALLRLGYFEGQITKYISRAKKKNGLQDYQKAHHYAVKMRELYLTRCGGILGFFLGRMYTPQHAEGVEVHRAVNEFCREQGLDNLERSAILITCLWRHVYDLDYLIQTTETLKNRMTPEEPYADQLARQFSAEGEADAGYVCQDPDLQGKEHPKPVPNAKWPFET